MAVVRAAVLLLLLVCAGCFAVYAYTGDARYKRLGMITLKWTVLAALAFFAVLIADRLLA